MDDARLQVECPHCGALFMVEEGPAGRQENCPVCQGQVRLLEPQAEHEPVAAAAAQEPQDYFARRPRSEPPDQEAGPCLVCCVREQKLNPRSIGRLVSSFTGLVQRDAAMQVTHGMGILAEGLAPDTATHMVEALGEEGIEAFTLPVARVPELLEPVQYRAIFDADEEALHVQVDAEGTVRALKWDAVVAGVCTKERFGGRRKVEYGRDVAVAAAGLYGVPAPARLGRRRRVTEVEAPVMLSLALRDNQGRLHRMTVAPRQVRYAYLGERLTANREANFARFLADVAKWATHAFFPTSYRQVAAGHWTRVVTTVGKVDYENYLRWAVCCALAGAR